MNLLRKHITLHVECHEFLLLTCEFYVIIARDKDAILIILQEVNIIVWLPAKMPMYVTTEFIQEKCILKVGF